MYAKLFRSILLPSYEIIRFRKSLIYLRELERNQWLSEYELKKLQWQKLKNLLKFSYDQVPYYHRKFDEIGLKPEDIRKPEDFSKLPLLTKDDIQKNKDSLIARTYKNKNLIENWTGGSTGEPLRFVYPYDTYEQYMATAIRSDRWTGWDLGEKTIHIWGPPADKLSAIRRIKESMYHRMYGRKLINPYKFSDESLKLYIQKINRFNPKFIVAYATPLYNLARFIYEKGMKCIRPRAIITTAEMLYPNQRELIEKVFKCKVFNRYGCREVMLIAAECECHKGLHLNIDNLYIEFLKNNEEVPFGETGEIVITSLNNYGMPLIRYRIGDTGVPTSKKCSCGRGLPLMEEVQGRTVDTIVTPSGKYISGIIFNRVFNKIDNIRQYQVIQETIDRFIIKIVPRVNTCSLNIDLICKNIAEILDEHLHSINIDVQIVEDIQTEKSGKLRPTISKVPVNFGNINSIT